MDSNIDIINSFTCEKPTYSQENVSSKSEAKIALKKLS